MPLYCSVTKATQIHSSLGWNLHHNELDTTSALVAEVQIQGYDVCRRVLLYICMVSHDNNSEKGPH